MKYEPIGGVLSEMSVEHKDKYILNLERRIAELEGKMHSIQPNDLHRATFLHKALTDMMAPFSKLRNTATIVEQIQHSLNQQSYLEGEIRDIRRMVGLTVQENNENNSDKALRQAMKASGKSQEEIDVILANGQSFG